MEAVVSRTSHHLAPDDLKPTAQKNYLERPLGTPRTEAVFSSPVREPASGSLRLAQLVFAPRLYLEVAT